MTQQIRTFGVKETNRLASAADAFAEEVKIVGYTIMPGVLAEPDLAAAREKLDRIYQQQIDEMGGRDQLAAIGDTYTAMCPLAYDDFFLSMVTNRQVLDVVERLLGDYFTLMLQNGIINVPEVGDAQVSGHWHRDIGYQHFTTSRPLGVTALYCVDDFNAQSGGTRVLPSSHKIEAFPSDEYVRRHDCGIEAPAGSVVILDSMLYHRAGHNRSNRVRRGVNNVYTLPLIKQQISLPQALGESYREDKFLARLLGYESESDRNVIEFRRRRLKRKLGDTTGH